MRVVAYVAVCCLTFFQADVPRGSADVNMIGAAVAIHITVLGILYMQVVPLEVSQQRSTLADIFKHCCSC